MKLNFFSFFQRPKLDTGLHQGSMTDNITKRLQSFSYASPSLYDNLPPGAGLSAASSFSMAAKLGVPVPNLAPNLDEDLIVPQINTTPSVTLNLEEVSTEPKKKKYAKEAWPGKKPTHSFLVWYYSCCGIFCIKSWLCKCVHKVILGLKAIVWARAGPAKNLLCGPILKDIRRELYSIQIQQGWICSMIIQQLSQLMRLWYSLHLWPATAQASLRIRAVSPEPSLFANVKYGSRRRVLSKIRHLAPLDGCACVFEEWVYKVPFTKCHNLWDGSILFYMLVYWWLIMITSHLNCLDKVSSDDLKCLIV